MPADDLTVPTLLATHRRHAGDRDAVVDDDRTITYADLHRDSRALAARLVHAGMGTSSRVGLLLPNSVDWVVTALAVTRTGAVLVPLSTLLRPPELLAQLRSASVTHLIAAPRFRGRTYLEELDAEVPGLGGVAEDRRSAAVPSLRRVWTPDSVPGEAAPPALVDALEAGVRPADDLVVLFTSGSRGRPKGVIHTHGSALRAVGAGLEARCVGADDRLYLPMPFFWTGGFGAGILSALVAGATLVTEAEPEPGRTLRFLERSGVTLFRGWPDQAQRLAAHPDFRATDLSRLRPASLPALLPDDRRPPPGARAALLGMTETMGPYSGARLDEDLPDGKAGSCGRPFAGIEARIVAPGTETEVDAGTEGEIRVRGRAVMRGICGRTRPELFDRDGFYPTGDLGVLDADGYLWYRGRLDDMFKVSGATVYPIEVEQALRGLAGVSEASVTDSVDDQGICRVAAMVVVEHSVDVATLADGARQRLSAFKVPTRWVIVDDPGRVPRLASGKVDVAALRRLVRTDGLTA
ncbi:class I adenylate-forming enzyme family protein [Cryptosporangium minutisporangium]|uniref:Class I adenylate-forming enzyme family protein n=1 Tax=Cryptosporangium minutisporangium TaxID=113569 RepID=A0ABP6T0Q2_9ACTN